jgi:hypothetical protein
MNHEIEVSNLMFNKTSNEEINFKKYDINVDLEEESSNDQKTVLKYSLDLTSNPKNSVINISGNTTLSGEQVSLIYQELFPLMYIISKNMKIPSPAHTISQNNVRESEQSNENSNIPNEKPVEIQTNDITDEVNETNQQVTESKEVEIKTDEGSEVQEEQNNEDKT